MQARALVVVSFAQLTIAAGCVGGAPDSSSSSQPGGKADGFGSVEPLGADPSGRPTQYPIILEHGFNASPTLNGFVGVDIALAADGHTVYVTDVPPFRTAEDRALALQQVVDQALANGAQRVNIIAHSMGGLDARALVSTLGYGDRVASITTISTPHRGSAIADHILAVLDATGVPDDALDKLAAVVGSTFSDLATDSDLRGVLTDLSEVNADTWNASHPDDPQVAYFSWAGVSDVLGVSNPADDTTCESMWLTGASGNRPPNDVMGVKTAATAPFVAHGAELLPNDGLVRVDSAKWGTFEGCIPADHLKEPGLPNSSGANPVTGFDHVRFYRDWAFYLASNGF